MSKFEVDRDTGDETPDADRLFADRCGRYFMGQLSQTEAETLKAELEGDRS